MFKIAYHKAEQAYPVRKPLRKALEMFLSDKPYRAKCFSSLQITEPERVMKGVKQLATDYNLSIPEQH